jgi:hypothetical protein
MIRVSSLAAACLVVAVAASAQQPSPRVPQRGGVEQPVQLQFQEGRVTLRAQDAPVRAILAEWARLGGATIVNGDRVTGPPLTLELAGVPERQALDVVLRTVAGYMLAPRRDAATGASAFDRIVILPTSVAPQNPPPAPRPTAGRPVPRPRLPALARPPAPVAPPPTPDVVPLDDSDDDVLTDDADAMLPPDPGMPQAPVAPRAVPRPVVRPPAILPGTAAPELVPEDPDPDVAEPAARPAVTPTVGNPFGIPAGSSLMPGVVSPAPRQPQPPQQ